MISQARLPGKLTGLKHLLTDQTVNKKTYCQDESGNDGKRFGNIASPTRPASNRVAAIVRGDLLGHPHLGRGKPKYLIRPAKESYLTTLDSNVKKRRPQQVKKQVCCR